jgi:hypothetical protein
MVDAMPARPESAIAPEPEPLQGQITTRNSFLQSSCCCPVGALLASGGKRRGILIEKMAENVHKSSNRSPIFGLG